MKITYDPDVDAMYLQLIEGDHQCRTVRLSDEVALDFGSEETLVGIEILDARRLLGKGKLPRLLVDNVALTAAPPTRSNGNGKATGKRPRRTRKRAAGKSE